MNVHLGLSRRLFTALALGGLLSLPWSPGCARAPEPPQCIASGVVIAGMAPAGELCLRFHAKDDPERMLKPEAVWTDPDGSFSLPIQLPGTYVVTAYWPKVTVVDGERIEGDDRLGGKFSHVNSPLRTLTIDPGENTIPVINVYQP